MSMGKLESTLTATSAPRNQLPCKIQQPDQTKRTARIEKRLTLKPHSPSSPCRPADCTWPKHTSCRAWVAQARHQCNSAQLGGWTCDCSQQAPCSAVALRDVQHSARRHKPALAVPLWCCCAHLLEEHRAVARDVAQVAAIQRAHLQIKWCASWWAEGKCIAAGLGSAKPACARRSTHRHSVGVMRVVRLPHARHCLVCARGRQGMKRGKQRREVHDRGSGLSSASCSSRCLAQLLRLAGPHPARSGSSAPLTFSQQGDEGLAVVKGHTHHSELLAGHQPQQPLAAGHDGSIRGL